MIFVNSPYELAYYTRTPDEPCYCEALTALADFYLYGELPEYGDTAEIVVLAADGLTGYEGVTIEGSGSGLGLQMAYGSSGGINFFKLTAESWAQVFCQYPCFVLRITIQDGNGQVIFDKYTEQYCLDSCCILPAGLVAAGATVELERATGSDTALPRWNTCERERHVLEAEFDCNNPFSGEVSGGENLLRKRVVIEGSFRQQPREITRQISLSCRIQKTESVRKYELWSFEIFPTWKMDEIENMLQAPRLFLDGKPVIFSGGTPFERIHKCKDWHRLKVVLEDCKIWQNTSCESSCETGPTGAKATYYVLPSHTDQYRDDAGRVIGYTDESLLQWLQARTGVTDAALVTDPLPAPAKVVRVKGAGKLPAYIYAGRPVPANKSFAVSDSATDPDFYKLMGLPRNYVACTVPVIGNIAYETLFCATPVIGEKTYADSCKTPVVSPSFNFTDV